jgi:hypothetical protein
MIGYERDEDVILDNEFINVRTPAEYIVLMFERTREDGLLIEPFFGEKGRLPGTESGDRFTKDLRFQLRCVMNWSQADCARVKKEFEALYCALSEIAKQSDGTTGLEEGIEKRLSPDLLKVWNTYLRRFRTESFDLGRILDIENRNNVYRETALDAYEKAKDLPFDQYIERMTETLPENPVSEEEENTLFAYEKMLREQAAQRLGRTHMAYELVTRSQRLCTYLSLGAPERIIQYEARRVAQAFAILSCATEFETVRINPITDKVFTFSGRGTLKYFPIMPL